MGKAPVGPSPAPLTSSPCVALSCRRVPWRAAGGSMARAHPCPLVQVGSVKLLGLSSFVRDARSRGPGDHVLPALTTGSVGVARGGCSGSSLSGSQRSPCLPAASSVGAGGLTRASLTLGPVGPIVEHLLVVWPRRLSLWPLGVASCGLLGPFSGTGTSSLSSGTGFPRLIFCSLGSALRSAASRGLC